nr:uncharacterized protein LOC127323200 [Lolium perenne]
MAIPLARLSSDHIPIQVKIGSSIPKANIFRFEDYWLDLDGFSDVVTANWYNKGFYRNPAQDVAARFKNLRHALKKWSKNISQLSKVIHNCCYVTAVLDGLEDQRALSVIERNFRNALKKHTLNLLEAKRKYWRKRANIKWAKLGDENTKFFHAIATRNYRHNYIASLIAEDGRIVTEHEQKAALLWHAYKDRLGTSENLTVLFQLTEHMANNELLELETPFSHQEIDDIIKNMPNDKSPGPDGFNGLQKVIIPLLHKNQYGFIKSRNIQDCLAWAFEYLDICHKSKKEIVILKIDFEKAFDKVEFNTILYMLKYLGFGDKFIGWIKHILESATTSIILNGVPGKVIKCKRGVRQGDPLSPILFVLAAELLQIVINKAWEDGDIALPIDRSYEQKYPVLQYADDTLIVFPADPDQLLKLKEILERFSNSTGLRINYHKTSMVPINISSDRCKELADLFQCKAESLPFTYLGLPMGTSRPKIENLVYIAHRVDKRLAEKDIWGFQWGDFFSAKKVYEAILNPPEAANDLYEDMIHLFFQCDFSQTFWWRLGMEWDTDLSLLDMLIDG